jgi:hypothetical protein
VNRDGLDEWFAQADDILTDWRPGGDAMHARPPADDGDALPPRADSYYEQGGPPDHAVTYRPTTPRGWALERQAARLTAEEARRRTVAELERLRSTVLVGPGSGWVVEIRDGVGRWQNLSGTDTYDFSDGVDGWDTPRIAFPEAADGMDDAPWSEPNSDPSVGIGWTTGMARDAEGRWRNLTDGTGDTP